MSLSHLCFAAALAVALAVACTRRPPPAREPADPDGTLGPRPTKPDDYGKKACRLARACYRKAGVTGAVAGRVEIRVDAAGHALAATYGRGTAPEPFRRCLTDEGPKLFLRGYAAGRGTFVCEYSGSVAADGVAQLEQRYFFTPEAPAAPAGPEAPAAPVPSGPPGRPAPDAGGRQ